MAKEAKSHNRIGIAFILNFSFTIIEIFGAIITNSMALLSDAIHDAGDSLSLALSWFLEKKSKKEPDKKYTYGYERFSLLGALVSSFILFGAAVFVLTKTIPRLLNPEEVDAFGMIIFSALGITFNGLAVIRLKKGRTHHEKIVTWHLLEDLLGWVAILITSIVLYFVDWYFLDPLLSIFIIIYIVIHVARNLMKVVRVLLQASPKDLDTEKIMKEITKFDGVMKAYHTHAWSLEGSKTMLTMHVLLSKDLTHEAIMKLKKDIRSYLTSKSVDHSTIEIEFGKK